MVLRLIIIRGTVLWPHGGAHMASDRTCGTTVSSTSQRRFVRNEHPMAMLLGECMFAVFGAHQTSTILLMN
jgi:hypothetical protein